MQEIYYSISGTDWCHCCGHGTPYSKNLEVKSFSDARDYLLEQEDAFLTTNDPIAKYYTDDERIIYKED